MHKQSKPFGNPATRGYPSDKGTKKIDNSFEGRISRTPTVEEVGKLVTEARNAKLSDRTLRRVIRASKARIAILCAIASQAEQQKEDKAITKRKAVARKKISSKQEKPVSV
jgi:hypothetical protein